MIQNADLALETNLEDLIKVDVKRSFTQDKNFPRETLFQILKCGALALNKGASYCQGMNYIAGFFLKQCPDEKVCFKFYISTIQNKMSEIFNENFKKLQAYFYVLDNLIKLFLPFLSNHFKSLKLQCVYYSSSWFITLFTSALQYTQKSFFVLYIMDLFMAEGYKAIFKTIICLLNFYQNKILKMNFEEVLEFFGSLIEKEIFVNSRYEEFSDKKNKNISLKDFDFLEEYEFVYDFKNLVKKFRIKNSLIFKLENRYEQINTRINKKL